MPPEQEHYAKKEDNNASLVVTMQYESRHFGFFGDAMEDRIQELLSTDLPTFDFVKLPYHGKMLDNYEAFLDRIDCRFAAATCSRKNPADTELLSLLEEKDITYYLTQNGSVYLVYTADEMRITQN